MLSLVEYEKGFTRFPLYDSLLKHRIPSYFAQASFGNDEKLCSCVKLLTC